MAFTEGQLAAYYGGNSHACVRLPMPPPFTQPEIQKCGKIVPPPAQAFDVVGAGGGLRACVRTSGLEVQCGYVEKLYTPNFFLDNWFIILAIAAVAYWLWREYRGKSDEVSS